jgi:hypothetical protein
LRRAGCAPSPSLARTKLILRPRSDTVSNAHAISATAKSGRWMRPSYGYNNTRDASTLTRASVEP